MDRRTLIAAGLGAPALAQLAMGQAHAQVAARSRLQTILQNGVLRAGATGDFNPMSFRDPATRELAGHQVDCMKKLSTELGVKLEWVPTTWPTLINGLTANQYDIVATGTSVSVARMKAAAFTNPWGVNAFAPLVRREEAAKYANWDSLNQPSVTVGFNLGTTFEQFVASALPKATVRRVESPVRDFQELLAGRVNVTITSLVEGSFLQKEYPQLQMILADQARNTIPLCFMTPIDDPIFLNFMNNWVLLHQTSGFFAELEDRWKLTLYRK
ncbi:MAG: transporter substrate-binding domain-containing protein [Rhodospirillales bacterium]|nr:transporter substrate-binding domain-containing protein [Rhodospirillales bacterium]